MTAVLLPEPGQTAPDADLERRFGGLRRLYGDQGYQRVRQARVAVVGLGGVGSWAAEALARSGVASLSLIDLDHVAESNINRQVQALDHTVGQAKALALQQRIADIHPGCRVHAIEEFVDAENWPGLLRTPVDAVIDACDQGHAKLAMARWALAQKIPLVVCGAAGGKRLAQLVEVADLALTSHDPLLASLRQRLRRQGAPRQGALGLACVFSREPVAMPAAQPESAAGNVDPELAGHNGQAATPGTESNLNCHGYGSSVTVTATFGMVAAGEVLRLLQLAR